MGNALLSWNDYPEGFKSSVWDQPMPPPQKKAGDEVLRVDLILPSPLRPVTVLFDSKGKLAVKYTETVKIRTVVKHCHWTPQSHMHDFEVIDPGKTNEFRVAKGQGVGVIIVDAFDAYLKLVYDEKEARGGMKVFFTVWGRSEEAKRLLDRDLHIGYDVFYLSGPSTNIQSHKLKYNRTPAPAEGRVWLPGLSPDLAEYKPQKETKTSNVNIEARKRKTRIKDGVEKKKKRKKTPIVA